eukprot:1160085-Pelagomonas_calceolata.AAC.3
MIPVNVPVNVNPWRSSTYEFIQQPHEEQAPKEGECGIAASHGVFKAGMVELLHGFSRKKLHE